MKETRSLSTIVIEPAAWRDLRDLRTLEVECFGDDAWSLWDLISVLSLPGVVRLKAALDGQLVGFVSGDPNPAENLGWVTTIGVFPAYQRCGIGRQLLARCEEALGQRFVRLCVRRSNLGAQALYRLTGYVHVTTWQRYYRDGEDALVMQKDRFPAAAEPTAFI